MNVTIEVPVGGEPIKWVEVARWGDAAEDKQLISAAIDRVA